MRSVPLHHLSPSGRAVIDAESVRVKQDLATRRAERHSRLHAAPGLDDMNQLTLPFLAAAEVDSRAEHIAPRA